MAFSMSTMSYLFTLFLLLVSLHSAVATNLGPASDLAKRQFNDIESESYQALIFQYLRKTLNDTVLVDLSTPESFGSVNLDFSGYNSGDRNMAVLKFLNQPDGDLLRDSVHEISISGHPPYERWDWLQLEKTILNLKKLKTIRWDIAYPISSKMLRSLEKVNPSAKLHYTIPFKTEYWGSFITPFGDDSMLDSFSYSSGDEVTQAEILELGSIVNSTNLHSLKAKIRYDSRPNQESMRIIFRALTTSPNIKELELSIHKSSMKIHSQPDAFDFRSNSATILPALEVLKLHGYNLESTSNVDWKDSPEDQSEDEDEDDMDMPYSPWRGAQQVHPKLH